MPFQPQTIHNVIYRNSKMGTIFTALCSVDRLIYLLFLNFNSFMGNCFSWIIRSKVICYCYPPTHKKVKIKTMVTLLINISITIFQT